MTLGTGTAHTRRTVTVQVDTDSLAWQFYQMAEDYERVKQTFDMCAHTTQRQAETIDQLRTENAALWAFVEADDEEIASVEAVVDVEHDTVTPEVVSAIRRRYLEAAHAKATARAALNELRGDR